MKAHREDASTRLRSQFKASAIGMAALVALELVFARPMMIELDSLNTDHLLRVTPALQAAARQETCSGTPASEPSGVAQLSWGETNAPAATARRQTSFSDDNYQPRSDVNVMPAPTEQYWYGGMPRYAQAEEVVRQEPWEWLGADRKRQHGRFEWVEQNGAINYASVCRNYRRGSILYRDCRKGAKRAFARMCSSYRPACHAANNFMP